MLMDQIVAIIVGNQVEQNYPPLIRTLKAMSVNHACLVASPQLRQVGRKRGEIQKWDMTRIKILNRPVRVVNPQPLRRVNN